MIHIVSCCVFHFHSSLSSFYLILHFSSKISWPGVCGHVTLVASLQKRFNVWQSSFSWVSFFLTLLHCFHIVASLARVVKILVFFELTFVVVVVFMMLVFLVVASAHSGDGGCSGLVSLSWSLSW
jgi:hypothetical protein